MECSQTRKLVPKRDEFSCLAGGWGGGEPPEHEKRALWGRVFVSGWRVGGWGGGVRLECRGREGVGERLGRRGWVLVRIYKVITKKKNLLWGWARLPIPTLVVVARSRSPPRPPSPSCRRVLGSCRRVGTGGNGWEAQNTKNVP